MRELEDVALPFHATGVGQDDTKFVSAGQLSDHISWCFTLTMIQKAFSSKGSYVAPRGLRLGSLL